MENRTIPGKSPRCFVPWQEMVVAASGTVMPCTYFGGFGNAFGCECGNVNQQSLLEIWNGEEYRRLRQFMLSDEGAQGCPGCLAIKQGLMGYPFQPPQEVLGQCEARSGTPYSKTAAWTNFQLMLDEVAAGRTELECVPTRISYTPSHLCNFNCRMCYEAAARELTLARRETVDAEIDSLLPRLFEIVMGGGEPFLQPLCRELLETYSVERNPLLCFAATTNGSLVDEDMLRALTRFPQVRLTFSLDGTTPEVFEAIRRGADFKRIMEHLQAALAVRDELGASRFTVGGNMAVMRSNFHQLPDMTRAMADWCMGVNLQPVNCYPCDECINMFNDVPKDLARFRRILDETDALYDTVPALAAAGLAAYRRHVQALASLIPFELESVPHHRIQGVVPIKTRRLSSLLFGYRVPRLVLFFPVEHGLVQPVRYWAAMQSSGRFEVSLPTGEFVVNVLPRRLYPFPDHVSSRWLWFRSWRIRVKAPSGKPPKWVDVAPPQLSPLLWWRSVIHRPLPPRRVWLVVRKVLRHLWHWR